MFLELNVKGDRADPSKPGQTPRVAETEISLNFNSTLQLNGGTGELLVLPRRKENSTCCQNKGSSPPGPQPVFQRSKLMHFGTAMKTLGLAAEFCKFLQGFSSLCKLT